MENTKFAPISEESCKNSLEIKNDEGEEDTLMMDEESHNEIERISNEIELRVSCHIK